MRRDRIGAIGLVLGTSGNDNFLPLGLLKNLEREARRHEQRLIVSHVDDGRLEDKNYVPGILRELAVDGLLIDYISNSPRRLAEMLDRYRVPAVWLNSKRKHRSVYVDDEEVGRRAAEHFASHGHRCVAFLANACHPDPARWHYSLHDRARGLAYGAGAHGMSAVPLPVANDPGDPRTVAVLGDALRRNDAPTGILANSEREAALAFAAAATAGLTVPRDLSLVALGPRSVQLPGLNVDTFVLPQGDLAAAAIVELNAALVQPQTSRPAVPVCFELLREHGSTAPPRSR